MKKILISANDPGGANSVVALYDLLCQNGFEILSIITGPARDIWIKKGLPFIDGEGMTDENVRAHLDGVVLFLAGTSAGQTFDKRILKLINDLNVLSAKKILSLYILDFWANYWQRFSNTEKDFAYLPDFICVPDAFAHDEMVAEGFDSKRIMITGNPHFDHFADSITKDREDKNSILFVSQPLSALKTVGNYSDSGYDEFNAINDLEECLNGLNLVIRLHPKDIPKKYDSLISKNPSVTLSVDSSLEESISRAGIVVGMNSPVLLQAAIAGKAVISYQPGLLGEDKLISNRLGLTDLVTEKDALQKKILDYKNGVFSGKNVVWPKNATENVLKNIVLLLNGAL